MGWLVAALVGAIIGALAEVSMRSNFGTLWSVLAGVIGALIVNAAILFLGSHLGDDVSFALAAVAGAPTLIGVTRMLRSRPTILG
jgi:uncharacterized membrane protein YeaQ/YmgE (transglycosylase-associated protein family)